MGTSIKRSGGVSSEEPYRLIFLCGMPLVRLPFLEGLLRQNPRFYGSGPSPLVDYACALRDAHELFFPPGVNRSDVAEHAFHAAIRALIGSFYRFAERPVVFHRDLSLVLDLRQMLAAACPETLSMVLVVRDLRAIAAEVGRPWPELFSNPQFALPLARLKQLTDSKEAARIFTLRTEDLAAAPRPTLGTLYDYLDEPWFEHDLLKPVNLSAENAFAAFDAESLDPGPPLRAESTAEELELMRAYPWFYRAFYPDAVSLDIKQLIDPRTAPGSETFGLR